MRPRRKFRRKTLRQWAAFARRGQRRGTYAHDHRLHRFEDEVILRKWRETGERSINAKRLAGLYPDLFEPRYLPRTLKRMEREGTISRSTGNRSRFGGVTYTLKEDERADAQAA